MYMKVVKNNYLRDKVMKKLLFLILVIPTTLFAQYGNTDSWVQFVVQYDFYAP